MIMQFSVLAPKHSHCTTSLAHLNNKLQITLEPGDLLYVPRHWWHYVESIEEDPTVSINTWVELVGLFKLSVYALTYPCPRLIPSFTQHSIIGMDKAVHYWYK